MCIPASKRATNTHAMTQLYVGYTTYIWVTNLLVVRMHPQVGPIQQRVSTVYWVKTGSEL